MPIKPLDTRTGNGYKILFGSNLSEETAQFRKIQADKNAGTTLPQPAWSDLIQGEWGSIVYNWIKTVGDPGGSGWAGDDVLGVQAYNIGKDPDGSHIWLIPTHRNIQGGRFNVPVYIEVQVYKDPVEQAKLEAKRLQDIADAKRLQDEVKIQNADAGYGVECYELTVIQRYGIFLAMSPEESTSCPLHPGVSIINPGAWERIAKNKPPAAFGLPPMFGILSYQPFGGVRIGTEEFNSVLEAAKYVPVDKIDVFGMLGLPSAIQKPKYSPKQIQMAQSVLNAMGVQW